MSQDLASLVIKLSADVATLQSDMGKAVNISKSAADQISATFSKSLIITGDVVKEFAGKLAAAFTIDKIVEVGRAVIDLGDTFNKMSQKVGVSVESLSALNNAAKLSDVSLDQLQTGLTKLAKNSADAASGGKETAAAFKAIGVSVTDSSGALKPTQQLLEEVSGKFASYADGAGKTAEAQKLFGKSGADLIPLLNQLGKDGFGAVMQAAKDYNQVIGPEQAKQSEEFNDNLTRLTMAGSGFANAIVKQMLPALVQYTNTMADASKTTSGYQEDAAIFATGAKIIILAVDFIKEAVKGLVSFILALGDSLGAAGDLFNGFAVAAMHDVNALGQAMRGNFGGAKEEMNQAGSSLAAGWEKSSARIKAAWAAADSGISAGQQAVEKTFQQLFGTFSNVESGVGVVTKKLKDMPLAENAAAAEKAAAAHEKLVSMLTKDAETLAKLRGEMDPYAKAQQEYVATIIAAQKAYEDEMALAQKAGASLETYARIKQSVIDKTAAAQAVLGKENAALAKQGDVLGKFLTDIGKSNALIGLTDKEKAVATAVQKVTDEWNKNTAAGIKNAQSLSVVADGAGAAAAASFDLEKSASNVADFVSQFGQKTEFQKFQQGIEDVGKALDKALGEGATEKVKQLQQTLIGVKTAMLEGIVVGAREGLQSLQSMTTSGSKAFKELQIAIDLTTIAEGVLAIIHQLSAGDVYSAIPRALAVAAAIVSLGVDVGNLGGTGGSQAAEAMQTSQGTGSVLGDSTAKSESIAKATEITANATTQLVGLNRGMLTALQALQNALGAAGNQLARGAGNATFSPLQDHTINLAGPGSSDPIGGFLGSFLFGGSQKVIDQGILIAGGKLQDMLDHIAVGAYQTVLTTGGLFGSDKTSQELQDVSSGFSKQFQLVIQSIADTVKAGAIALGLLPADVEAAIANYQVAAQQISLQGLSADDQQKALEAVFSKLFDGLAGAVVPFISQFQKVGEGLGETLVRVATEVQITQEAFKQLGLAVAQTDPEKFAQIADGLVNAAGGIDSFISGMQSFVKNFSDAAHQMDVDSTALASAFAQVGLTVPQTAQGMWDLMQSLDATTAEGQAQIATLLRLSDTAKSYYDQLDEFSKTLGLDGNSDFNRDLRSIQDAAIGLIKALSKAGASTETLQHVYDASVNKINELVAQMEASAQSIAFSLGISNKGSLQEVTSEIERLQGISDSASQSVSGFGNAMQEASQQASDAIALLLGDLSPLNDQKKLQIALQGLQAGTVSQDQVLEIGRKLYASTQKYKDLFAMVQQYPGSGGNNADGGSAGSAAQQVGLTQEQSDRLKELLKEQATLQAAATRGQYQTLAQQIAEIASAKGEDFQQVLDEMGIKDADLEKGLGLSNDAALKAYIENIQKQTASNKDGTTSIVDILKKIYAVLGGTNADDTTAPGRDGSLPDPALAHSGSHDPIINGGHSTRGGSATDVAVTVGQVIGDHIGRTLAPYQGNHTRSSRPPVRVN